ncbi:hypothetical protein ABG067_003696 [Albugo candida]
MIEASRDPYNNKVCVCTTRWCCDKTFSILVPSRKFLHKVSLSECINDETINGIPIKLRCLSRIRFSHRKQRRLKLDLSLDLSKSTDQTQHEVSKVHVEEEL